jgi:integrase
MSLTDVAIRSAKPQAKPFKLFDSGGLHLLITPTGGTWWRWKYRFAGKEKALSFGVYPDVTLKSARERRDAARQQLAAGIDPGEARKAEKVAQAGAESFEAIAREWHAKFSPGWEASHGDRIFRRLENDIFPWLGKRPVGEITDPKRIAEMLRAIDAYQGYFVTKCALRLAPLVFVRPGELRHAEWPEIDLERVEWRIPAERMKMREQHIVSLARQAVDILRELEPLTNRVFPSRPNAHRYVFPSARTHERPMSENAVLAALRRMGYTKEEMTGHGFRSMASTLLHEQGWNHQAIERQLAHAERNAVSAAYNFAEHLAERRKMMQAWADYLDGLKAGAELIPLFRKAE